MKKYNEKLSTFVLVVRDVGKLFFLLVLAGNCIEGTSTELQHGGDMKKTDQHNTKQKKFNFEEYQTAESAKAALSAMFPDGADAAEFWEVLTQAGAQCVKESMASSLGPEQQIIASRFYPENSTIVHCRYSKLVASSVAAEWEVVTVEKPDGRIKGITVSHHLVGP